MGNESIDLGLENIYSSWFAYKNGKKPSPDLDRFQYNLDKELRNLHEVLNNDMYEHGDYRQFIITDNKRRKISIASVRDRVVHRLLYDYLVKIFDKTFIYDAWSCRKGKGLVGAIERTQKFIKSYPCVCIWKVDIKKFFDNVDHEILLKILARKVDDQKALELAKTIIMSFTTGLSSWGGAALKGCPLVI